MALSRKHFTVLAEIIGGIEAGRIGPDDVRAVLKEHLLEDEPTFKADKFDKHTDTQRDEAERGFARDLKVGEGFVVGAQRFVAERIVHLLEPERSVRLKDTDASGTMSLNVETVEVRVLVDDERASLDDSIVVFYFDAAEII